MTTKDEEIIALAKKYGITGDSRYFIDGQVSSLAASSKKAVIAFAKAIQEKQREEILWSIPGKKFNCYDDLIAESNYKRGWNAVCDELLKSIRAQSPESDNNIVDEHTKNIVGSPESDIDQATRLIGLRVTDNEGRN